MFLSNELNKFIARLKACDELSDCKIFKAYPFLMKPTRLNCVAIAVSVGEVEAENISIGDEQLNGKYKINAVVYSPYKNNDFSDVISAVLRSQLGGYPSAVSVSEINKNDDIECFYVKTSFEFYDNFSLGGADDE